MNKSKSSLSRGNVHSPSGKRTLSWLERIRASNKEKSKLDTFDMGIPMLMLWTSVTTFLFMFYVSSNGGVSKDSPKFLLLFWLCSTVWMLIYPQMSKASVSKWWISRNKPIFGILFALMVGTFQGGVLFSMFFIDVVGKSILVNTEMYQANQRDVPSLDKPLFVSGVSFPENSSALSNKTTKEQMKWFDDFGNLLPAHRAEWCAIAMPRAIAFQDMIQVPSMDGAALNNILALNSFRTAHANGCLDSKELLLKGRQMYDYAVKNPGRAQATMEKLSWFPIFYLLAPANTQLLDSLIPSPAWMCKEMAKRGVSVDLRQVALMKSGCEAHFNNKTLATEDDLPRISDYLGNLK